MNIENYVNQLAGDIEDLLSRTPPCELYPEKEDFIEATIEFEEHVLNNEGAWVSDYTGIKADHLPAADLLTEGQAGLLVSGIMNLLDHYNFHPVFPDSLPPRQRYIKLREEWNKFKAPIARYDYYYEFCNYEEEECPFPGYCDGCREVQKFVSTDFKKE